MDRHRQSDSDQYQTPDPAPPGPSSLRAWPSLAAFPPRCRYGDETRSAIRFPVGRRMPQDSRVGGQKAPIAQCSPRKTGLLHFIPNAGIAPPLPFHILDNAPRDGSIAHTDFYVCHRSLLLLGSEMGLHLAFNRLP